MPESREKTEHSAGTPTTAAAKGNAKSKAKKASSRKTGSTARKQAAAPGDAKPKRKYVTRKRSTAAAPKARPTVKAIKSALASPSASIEIAAPSEIPTPDATAAPAESRTPSRAPLISGAERRRMIAERAYYLSQERGYRSAGPDQDWLDAEAEIDAMILGGQL